MPPREPLQGYTNFRCSPTEVHRNSSVHFVGCLFNDYSIRTCTKVYFPLVFCKNTFYWKISPSAAERYKRTPRINLPSSWIYVHHELLLYLRQIPRSSSNRNPPHHAYLNVHLKQITCLSSVHLFYGLFYMFPFTKRKYRVSLLNQILNGDAQSLPLEHSDISFTG